MKIEDIEVGMRVAANFMDTTLYPFTDVKERREGVVVEKLVTSVEVEFEDPTGRTARRLLPVGRVRRAQR